MTDARGWIQDRQDFYCDTDIQACVEAQRRLGKFPRADVWAMNRWIGMRTLPKIALD